MNQHITENAIVRCPECDENFCEKCKTHHEFAKATKNHEVISIEHFLKLPKFVQDINFSCPEHEESFVFYCDEHEKPCCAYCFHNAHIRCRNLTPLHTLTKNIKESSSLADLETTISDLMKNLTNINDLEADLLDKLQKTFIEKELQIQNMLKDIELRKSKISEMKENVTIVKCLASQFQTFMVMREFTHIANTVETYLQRLFDSGSFNWTEILGTQTDIQSVKYHFTSIGEIDIRINPSKIELNVRKSREAQIKGFKVNIQSKHIRDIAFSIQQQLCDICINQHITEDATVQCPECEEYFCDKCKIHHQIAKASSTHEIVSIENDLKLPKFVQDIKNNCAEHDEKFVLYCDDHGVPCCSQCIHNAHARCRKLTSFHRVVQNAKDSPLFMDLETTLSGLITNITNIIEDRTENLLYLAEQKMRCKKEIKITRDALNTYFDDLEADLLVDLPKTFTENELRIQNMLKDLELQKSKVCEMQEDVNIVKSIASGFQSFMAIRELTKSANTTETGLQDMYNRGSFNWIEISNGTTILQSVKDNLKSFGKPNVRNNPSKIKLNVQKTRAAQLIGPMNLSITRRIKPKRALRLGRKS
ncbi:unnamed protein product [Mytilus coruscus]|uniref:B box-type domain-containing protein n=1 Tax=Mytilus coruscus TaxID=42192 RepID=A0A6J8F4D4_MYTCO|nr:unnamed protein product [Mytilus coruscus]